MIGIVIVTHGPLGQELQKTAEFIVGVTEHCQSVSIEINQSPELMRHNITEAIKQQNSGQGVLILTDMFGGTPSNISLSFLEEGIVEVLTGVNLPMLLRALQQRDKSKLTLADLAQDIGEYARKSINVAGDMLGRRSQTAPNSLKS